MKLKPRTKKILTVLLFVGIAATLTGCTVPRDSSGNIILIDTTTTFKQVMSDENWFSAIFVWPLAQAINHMTPKMGVGLAITVITVIVNGVLAAATIKGTVGSQEMQLIQPEIQKLQRKYEGRDDPASKQKMAMEMQQLYASHDIHPMGTMVGSFLQLPILMAMYMAVQRAAAVQNGSFMGLNLNTTPLTGMKEGQWMYLLIFALMGLTQFVSMYLPMHFAKKKAEAAAAKQHRKPEETSGSQQKLMQIYMMAMILIFGLMWPTAMTVYWTINSCVTIVKTIIVQKYIDHRQAEKRKA